MLSESAAARRRRRAYHRAHTITALPYSAQLIPEEDNEDDADDDAEDMLNEHSTLIRVGESPTVSRQNSSDGERSEPDDDHRPPPSPRLAPQQRQCQTRQQEATTSSSSSNTALGTTATSSSTGGGGAGNSSLGIGGTPTTPTGGGRTPITKKRIRFHQRSVTMAAGSSSSSTAVSTDQITFSDKEKDIDLAATYHGSTSQSKHKKSYGNTHHISKTSAPSMLFTKVKERIREKVFQSSEWPSAAAMIQEKRQRANDLLEASLTSRKNLNLEQIQLQQKKKALRSKGDTKHGPTGAAGTPGTTTTESVATASKEGQNEEVDGDVPKETVRQAFLRRRSISEDTYDRQPCVVMKSGIVCSNEDLMDIMQEQQCTVQQSKAYRRKSPRPLKKHLRTQSLDIARMTQRELQHGHSASIYLDPQVSMESSSSTVSSIRTLDSASSEMNLRCNDFLDTPTVGRGEAPSSPSSALYPEIVLDDKSKETIMEETKDNDEDEDTEEEECGGKKIPKPVPEIVFDENGQTWDVYGAEFDPEVLGLAIQRHLEKMMEGMMAPQNVDEDSSSTKLTGTCGSKVVDTKVESRQESSSFWLRLMCLFAGKNDVTT